MRAKIRLDGICCVATLAFSAITFALLGLSATAWFTWLAAMAVLVVSLLLIPRPRAVGVVAADLPRWDIPARMVVATLLVVALTQDAPLLGPRLAGLVAPFPLYAMVLAVFSHRLQGAASAVRVLRGLLLGLFAFAGFFLTIALLLNLYGIAIAFAAAAVVAMALQALSLFVGRRLPIA